MINSIISDIFESGLRVRDSKKDRDSKEVYGFYIDLVRKDMKELDKLKPFDRLFHSCKNLAGKRVRGENMQSDFENTFAQMLEF